MAGRIGACSFCGRVVDISSSDAFIPRAPTARTQRDPGDEREGVSPNCGGISTLAGGTAFQDFENRGRRTSRRSTVCGERSRIRLPSMKARAAESKSQIRGRGGEDTIKPQVFSPAPPSCSHPTPASFSFSSPRVGTSGCCTQRPAPRQAAFTRERTPNLEHSLDSKTPRLPPQGSLMRRKREWGSVRGRGRKLEAGWCLPRPLTLHLYCIGVLARRLPKSDTRRQVLRIRNMNFSRKVWVTPHIGRPAVSEVELYSDQNSTEQCSHTATSRGGGGGVRVGVGVGT